MSKELAKADHVRWDLSIMYSGIDDPRIDQDVAELVGYMQTFAEAYRGKLDTRLGAALESLSTISMLQTKIGMYLSRKLSLDTNDSAVKAKLAEVIQKVSAASGEYMTFWDIELAALPEKDVQAQVDNPVVKKHLPYIEQMRVLKPFMLSEPVESALTKRSPFGSDAWTGFCEELQSDLTFAFSGETHTLSEMLHLLSESQDAAARAEMMRTVNEGLKGPFAKYVAETLYVLAGAAAVERRERGYKHPMQGINISNRVPDSVVDALIHAVTHVAAPLAQRFYKLKAAHLGVKTLRWSDRNAPMPFADSSVVPFDDGMKLVLEAYESFSPKLAELIREIAQRKCIDAPTYKGKQDGAYNASGILPGNIPTSFVLLNYEGSGRDVMTLAHELGHGVHGLLASEAQGPLMDDAPIAFAETASVFGEMVTFDFLKRRLEAKGDTKSLLALVMGKIDDIVNTTVRQIGFLNFERRLHGMDETYTTWREPQKYSVEELCALWDRTLEELYGDALSRENTSHLWAYISHFRMRFYVYGYAFGDVFTTSLYAKRGELGTQFEPLYLDLLRAGDTKDAFALVKPFGLDPASESFWTDGLRASLGTMLEEAERLSREIDVTV